MGISLIVACNEDFMIGCSKTNSLPYYIRNDLKRFKEKTLNNYVVMGRNTYESLPSLLPQRTNVILSKSKKFSIDKELYNKYDIIIENDLEKILNQYTQSGQQSKEMFLIGGSYIFAEGIHHAENVHLTLIHDRDHPEADIYFNKAELSEFKIVHREKHYDEESGLYYSFIDYKRKEKVNG